MSITDSVLDSVNNPPRELKMATEHMDGMCRAYNYGGWIPMGRWLWHHIIEEEKAENIFPGQKVLELGSGSGSSTLSWSYAGYPIIGIELEERLASTSKRALLEYKKLQKAPLKIITGSYYPKEYIEDRNNNLHEHIKRLEAEQYGKRSPEQISATFMPVCDIDVYKRESINISDFDIVFGFFWPHQLPSIYHMFLQYARNDAVLFAIGNNNQDIATRMGLKTSKSKSNVFRK